MAGVQKTTIVGLKNVHYAIMDSDTATAATYRTPVKVGRAVSVDIQPQIQTAKLYGDDTLVDSFSVATEYNITIETTDLPLEDQAALLGHTYESDAMIVKTSDVAPDVALMFEAPTRGGDILAVKFYKGKFNETQETINTKGENMEYQVPRLEGIFTSRFFDDQIIMKKIFAKGTDTSSWYASVDNA